MIFSGGDQEQKRRPEENPRQIQRVPDRCTTSQLDNLRADATSEPTAWHHTAFGHSPTSIFLSKNIFTQPFALQLLGGSPSPTQTCSAPKLFIQCRRHAPRATPSAPPRKLCGSTHSLRVPSPAAPFSPPPSFRQSASPTVNHCAVRSFRALSSFDKLSRTPPPSCRHAPSVKKNDCNSAAVVWSD